MDKKVCTKCLVEKELSMFDVVKSKRKDGSIYVSHRSRCKECENKRKYLLKTNSPEKLIIYKEKSNTRRKKSYDKNKLLEKQRQAEWLNNKKVNGSYKNMWLLNKYKISQEIYDDLRFNQNYCCAICGISEEMYKKSFHVDHCHVTNKIRGLLCHKCNMGLGLFKDSEELLLKSINYLKQ